MSHYKFTIIGTVLALLVYVSAILLDLDAFETVVAFFDEMEHLELDELIIPFMMIVGFSVIDLVRAVNLRRMDREKTKVYKAMARSANHVLNNFLNQVQLVKITADETPGFDPEVLALYDKTINEATTQIEALSSLTEIDEHAIWDSVNPSKP